MPQWSTGIKRPPALSTLSSKIRDRMATVAAPLASDLLRRVIRLQVLTIAWMTVEAIVAVGAAWMARGLALLGFGGGPALGTFFAVLVFFAFRSQSQSSGAEQLSGPLAACV